jgi:hypothetical protein
LLCSTLSNKQTNKQANGRYKGHVCVKKWCNTSWRLARVANIEEDHSWFRLSFGFIAPKHLIIAWLSNLLILSVADEGYYRNESCTLNFISTFLFCLYCNKMKKKYYTVRTVHNRLKQRAIKTEETCVFQFILHLKWTYDGWLRTLNSLLRWY